MISTLHGAWWETLFGTEPSRKRLVAGHALVADHDEVGAGLLGDVEDRVGRVALAGEGARPSRPRLRAFSAASLSVASTSSRGLTIHSMSFGHLALLLAQSRLPDTGSYAETRLTDAPTCRASSVACRTALPAVSDPSVPTTIELNMVRAYITTA